MILTHLVMLCAVLAPLTLGHTILADTPSRAEVEGGAVVGAR